MTRRSIPVDDDPVLHRAQRVLADVGRVMRTIDRDGLDDNTAARRRIVALASDLELLIRVLKTSRDALGLELASRTRQINAISAYGRVRTIGRQYAHDMRRRTCTE